MNTFVLVDEVGCRNFSVILEKLIEMRNVFELRGFKYKEWYGALSDLVQIFNDRRLADARPSAKDYDRGTTSHTL